MKYNIGDKFILEGIECRVFFIDVNGEAYIAPEIDGELYNNAKTFTGVAFTRLNNKGKDLVGNKAVVVSNVECGAV